MIVLGASAMTKEQLAGPRIARLLVDERDFRAARTVDAEDARFEPASPPARYFVPNSGPRSARAKSEWIKNQSRGISALPLGWCLRNATRT